MFDNGKGNKVSITKSPLLEEPWRGVLARAFTDAFDSYGSPSITAAAYFLGCAHPADFQYLDYLDFLLKQNPQIDPERRNAIKKQWREAIEVLLDSAHPELKARGEQLSRSCSHRDESSEKAFWSLVGSRIKENDKNDHTTVGSRTRSKARATKRIGQLSGKGLRMLGSNRNNNNNSHNINSNHSSNVRNIYNNSSNYERMDLCSICKKNCNKCDHKILVPLPAITPASVPIPAPVPVPASVQVLASVEVPAPPRACARVHLPVWKLEMVKVAARSYFTSPSSPCQSIRDIDYMSFLKFVENQRMRYNRARAEVEWSEVIEAMKASENNGLQRMGEALMRKRDEGHYSDSEGLHWKIVRHKRDIERALVDMAGGDLTAELQRKTAREK